MIRIISRADANNNLRDKQVKSIFPKPRRTNRWTGAAEATELRISDCELRIADLNSRRPRQLNRWVASYLLEMNVDAFLEKFTCWAKEQSDIEGAALIGSYAGGTATENSDVDLMILTTSVSRYLDNKEWLLVFGEIVRWHIEPGGVLETMCTFSQTGLESSYTFAATS